MAGVAAAAPRIFLHPFSSLAMTLHDPIALKETLNRAAKIDVDSGAAADFETAVRRLHGHRVQVRVGREVATSAAHQAALLTVVNVARRFALGGVLVEGPLEGAVIAGPVPGIPWSVRSSISVAFLVPSRRAFQPSPSEPSRMQRARAPRSLLKDGAAAS